MYLDKPDTGPDISRLRLDSSHQPATMESQEPQMYMPQPQYTSYGQHPADSDHADSTRTQPQVDTPAGKIRIAKIRKRVPDIPTEIQHQLKPEQQLAHDSNVASVNTPLVTPPSAHPLYFTPALPNTSADVSGTTSVPVPTVVGPDKEISVGASASLPNLTDANAELAGNDAALNRGRNASQPLNMSDTFVPPAQAPLGLLTVDQFEMVRRHAATQSHDPRAQLELARRLCEAADHLAHRYTDPTHPSSRDVDAAQQTANWTAWTDQALTIAKQLAHQTGYSDAQFFLGSVWSSGGYGVDANSVKALEYYLRAARQDHPEACYRVAVCEEFGVGTTRDMERALQYYKRAALLGNVGAMYKLGMLSLAHPNAAPDSNCLGVDANNTAPDTRDFLGGLTWLERAAQLADARNPHALHELGLLYEHSPTSCYIAGDPIPLSPSRALELHSAAATLGYAPAQARLGRALEFGELGCEVEPVSSLEYYYAAANQGDSDAELAMAGWCWTGGPSLPKSETEALQWAERAAQRGNVRALYCLGYFCESGIGQAVDMDRAWQYYELAAQRGHERAIEKVATQAAAPTRSAYPIRTQMRPNALNI